MNSNLFVKLSSREILHLIYLLDGLEKGRGLNFELFTKLNAETFKLSLREFSWPFLSPEDLDDSDLCSLFESFRLLPLLSPFDFSFIRCP